jgi:hypothetical protein
MRWFRANVRVGTWCALVAMALQLVLTFGHVHASVSSAASLWLAAQGTAQDLVAPVDGPRVPLKPLIDHCATCALIHMAGAGVPPATVSLPLPHPVAAASLTFSITSEPASSKPIRVNARGPPLA